MTARHKFYGQLHADDIVDLPDFIANLPSAQPGGEGIIDLGEIGNLGFFKIDPDIDQVALATSYGSTYLLDHRPAQTFTLTTSATGFTITAVVPPDSDASYYPTWQVIWLGSEQNVSDIYRQFTYLNNPGDTHVVSDLPTGQTWSIFVLATWVLPDTSDPVYNWGSTFTRLAGDATPVTGPRYYSPPYPGTDWRLAAAKGARGPLGPAGDSATVAVESTTTVAWDAPAAVTEDYRSTPSNARLHFSIPRGRGFTPRGEWTATAGTLYQADDLVTYQGATYRAKLFHPADTGNAPTGSGLLWELWSARGAQGPAGPTGASGLNFRGVWNRSATYAVNDLVTWGGSGYVALEAKNTISPPPTGTPSDPGTDDTAVNVGWTLLVMEGARGPQGIQGVQGTPGTNGTNGTNGQGFTNRGGWSPSTAYNAFDVLTYAGSTYLVLTGHTSGSAFSTANLQLWAAKGDPGQDAAAGSGGSSDFSTYALMGVY